MYTEKDYVRTQCKGMTAKTILEKKSKVAGFTRLEFIVYYKAAVIKTMKYWPKDRHIDQWNQEIDLHLWSVDFQQGCQANSIWKKNHLFNK